ncbi:MAG TPA: hypothetical protein P5545_03435 [Bacteroidota bacterium]|nr:hypothetical protein [Bacteroidota bacterium]
MKIRSIFFIFLLTIANLSLLYSQTNMKGEKESVDTSKQYTKYIVRPKYPINLAFHYMYTDNTKFEQILSDSTIRQFERNIIYYFTLYSPGNIKDGFTTLRVSIDSLEYTYKSGIDSIYYNSQSDSLLPPFNIKDFDISSVILGKNFDFIYSPYWDIGKIEESGEGNVIEKRRFINDPVMGIDDPYRKYLWNFQLSDENLGYTVDLLKGIIPIHSIDTNMVRIVPIRFAIENLSFLADSAKVKLITANSNKYVLRADFNHFVPLKKEVVIPEFLTFVNFEGITGDGSYILTLTPQGRVDSGELKLKLNLQFRDRKEIINEKIEKHSIWQLLDNYKI